MKRRDARCVVLVCEDVDCLMLVATELAETGCVVVCARDVGQAADFVRAGLSTQFVLVLIGQLEWMIECDDLGELTGPAIAEARFVN